MHTDTETSTTQPAIAAAPAGNQSTVSATAPGKIRVIKRNGTVVPFDASKIEVAVTKAFLAVEGGTAAASSRIRETVKGLSQMITAVFTRRMPSGGTIHIEEIQDQVELALMRTGEQKVARDYVLYREEHARARAAKRPAAEASADPQYPAFNVIQADGSRAPLDLNRIRTVVSEACAGLKDVSDKAILDEAMRNLYDGVSLDDVNTSLVITARTLVEKEPNYTFIKGDITNEAFINDLFAKHQFDGVLHLAAESHVDRSIDDPFSFARTNIMGTLSLLQAAKEYWNKNFENKLFYHVSTDGVYGSLGDEGFF